MVMEKIQILLSTYNGEQYLREQLDSLLYQSYPEISILIRDDGSVDNTISILEEYSYKDSRIKWYKGNNIGVWKSFFDLMENADTKADYYAFCDQDDYWLKEKIEKGIQYLKRYSQNNIEPILYCSNTINTDKVLKKMPNNQFYYNFRPAFGNAIIQNIARGCTCIFNRVALNLAIIQKPQYMIMHDWWLYLVCSCFGKVCFDNNAYILYRQHESNVIGTKDSVIKKWMYRFVNLKNYEGRNYLQIKEFRKIYSVSYDNTILIDSFLSTENNVWKRVLFISNKKIYRQNKVDDFLYRILVFIGLA